MNKTDRKNKTNLVVKWPTHGSYFTFEELVALNPDFKEITLRVRLEKSMKTDKIVSLIGTKNVGKGRPVMVIAMNPVTQEMLDKAYIKDEIQPPQNRPVVTIQNVTNKPAQTDIPIHSELSTEAVSVESTEAVAA